MIDTQSLEIKPHPLARWFFGCILLPASAFMLIASISYYSRSDYSGCVVNLLAGIFLALLTLKTITTKILLSDDGIEIRSMVLPNKKMLKQDIRSKTPYSGAKGAHGFWLNPTSPAIRKMRVDLTILSSADEKRVRDFLRNIPVESRKR